MPRAGPCPTRCCCPRRSRTGGLLEALLSEEKGAPLRLLAPQAGERARLWSLAAENARSALKRRRTAPEPGTALLDLQERLNLPQAPGRLECLDISTLQGEQPVGSLVAFVNGAPDKSGYRRFRIKGVAGQDDYAMLREVVLRHYGKEGQTRPDLLVVDGGRGQLNVVLQALKELGLSDLTVVGLAKAGMPAGARRCGTACFCRGARIPYSCRPTPRAGCCSCACGTKPTASPSPFTANAPAKRWWSRSWTKSPASARCGAKGCCSIFPISRP